MLMEITACVHDGWLIIDDYKHVSQEFMYYHFLAERQGSVSYTHLDVYKRQEDVPEHTLFVITTDGMENASRRYDSETVKKMIERQKEKYGLSLIHIFSAKLIFTTVFPSR